MSTAWSGEIDIGPAWALFVGQGGETRLHAHLAHKVVVSLDGEGDVEGAERVEPGVWFVGSDVSHRVLVRGVVALGFVDAGSVGIVHYARLPVVLAAAARALRSPENEARIAGLKTLVAALPVLPDARVARAAQLLREGPQAALGALAERVALSLPRLSHLFASRLGVSPRRYRTWGGLRRAVDEMARGASLTEAAHAAGFADSAHFSRTFAGMFGVVPSAISRTTTIRRHDA
ncbi:MAG: helix-turn-helix transcriptional regulator [Polyangiaceae bacterium]|nr:helix-turn-helix transcriptional regulator [Polyangiaceae bacterium]